MPLPETIVVRRAEEDAGYMAMTPVVTQTFRLEELVDMVVSVAGKNAPRVGHILSAGSVIYNSYRYSWQGFSAQPSEIAALLASFPDDDPSREFEAATVTAVILEIGGGTQRTLVEILRETATSHRLFSRRSPWDVLLEIAKQFPARYEKYDHARRADLYHILLRYEDAQGLLAGMREVAPRALRFEWRGLRPPAVITYVSPRSQKRSVSVSR